jgi:U3 small nucleolar ribonucleoprotein component
MSQAVLCVFNLFRAFLQEEIETLFKSFVSKLDALSNFHFTPKMPSAEVTVVANVPAIQMEEVLPLAVNDNARQAPEEVYGAKSGRYVPTHLLRFYLWITKCCL